MTKLGNFLSATFLASHRNDRQSECARLSKRASLASCYENIDDSNSEQVMPANDASDNKMKSLMNELQLNGKILLACV